MDYNDTTSDETNSKQSKFNSGALITLRLNELINDANKHARNGELAKWNADLDRMWCELVGDLETNSNEKKTYEAYKNAIASIGNLTIRNTSGFSGISEEQQIIRAKQQDLLQKKEEFIRVLINTQGKGTAYSDESSDYMD